LWQRASARFRKTGADRVFFDLSPQAHATFDDPFGRVSASQDQE
jgi:hypothetical protein